MSGTRIITGMPKKTLSASSPPTPQPSTPMPLIIGVWLSVPISVSGMAHDYAVALRCGDDGRETLEIERVHDARAGRMHTKPEREPVAHFMKR